ncbi:DUF7342 family protein [Haloquadratum walsbyi]|uniref:DUF7342 family protein n=1 Tax=Haloquadratum walsbyi TaxID=293091 RepID=UPI0015F4204A|nr:hypothetical protein [Haloquadratum walsbyi]
MLVTQRTTGADRVRMVARQLTEPRTANWIASEADWFYEPTKRVPERLVDNGVIRRTDEGRHTTYRPDYRQQAMREAMALCDDADSVEQLTDRLSGIKTQIQEWKSTCDVSSPNELRATIADTDLSSDKESEHLEGRLEIVRFAVREWDFLSSSAAFVETSD